MTSEKIKATVDGITSGEDETPFILVVDDSRAMRTLATKVLGTAGMDTEAVDDGSQALKYLRDRHAEGQPPVSLVMLDLNMPVMDGRTFLEKVRQDQDLKNTRVLVCSTENDRKNITVCAKLGISGYILKPYTTAKLLEEIRGIIYNKGKSENMSEDKAEEASQSAAGTAQVKEVITTIEAAVEQAVSDNSHADCPVAKAVREAIDDIKKQLD